MDSPTMPYASFSGYWGNAQPPLPLGSVEIFNVEKIFGKTYKVDNALNFTGGMIISFFKYFDSLTGTLLTMRDKKSRFRSVAIHFNAENGIFLQDVEVLGLEFRVTGSVAGEQVGLRSTRGSYMFVLPEGDTTRSAAYGGQGGTVGPASRPDSNVPASMYN